MPLILDATTLEILAVALPDAGTTRHWQVGHIAPMSLRVEGNKQARRLLLVVDIYLMSVEEAAPLKLRGQLVSAAWSPLASMPPAHQLADIVPEVAPVAKARLDVTLAAMSQPIPISDERSWLQFLSPAKAMATHDEEASVSAPLVESLPQALKEWLTHVLPATTVAEAIDLALHGPVGYFGPVEPRVLERSGQADLAVDATWLGEADNGAQQGGQTTSILTLYGERHGNWLLHRRNALPTKARNKQETPPLSWTCEVLVTASAKQLVELAGLGTLEKRLFQQAGVLPHARLWPDGEDCESDRDAGADVAGSTFLDLSQLADRPRRHLQAIVSLAQEDKLSPQAIDLLLRVARQLAK
ncbi:hypothetical protein [Halomonas sp.]|uniref:hypothetical protein n=1 Tax=Halomonas sp. TaxID=1486246 RepID=UPI00384F4106